MGKPAGKGNTPTGVGKTLVHIPAEQVLEKHPHGRGEDMLKSVAEPR